MRRLTYENGRGDSISFYLSPFLIESLTGIGEVGADLQGQRAPYQDGDNYVSTVLNPRYINLEGSFTETDKVGIRKLRSQLTRTCNPKLGLGKITLELDGNIKEIRGALDGVPVLPERGGNPHQSFMITWKCPNPYWQSESITEEPTFEPLFEFPFEGEFEMGIQRDKRIINNDGDAPAPLKVEFHGPALNPVIINNTTGEFIKINQELLEGERMMIDTTESEKSVYFVGDNGDRRNVFNWLDLDSTFFKLEVGENEIEYSADNDIQGAVVNISYSKLYTAV